MVTNLIIFFLYLIAVIYFAGFVLIKSPSEVRIKEVYMYSGTLALIGVISEVAINSFCRATFQSPLWVYLVTPVHNGDTSMFAFFQWALYGYHLYFVKKKIHYFNLKHETYIFVLVLSVEALLLEIFVNISSSYFLDTFIFYYVPEDMGHMTSIYVFPVYLLGGAILNETFKRFLRDPLFFGNLSFSIAFIFVFLA